MGTGKRSEYKGTEAPGPGQYELKAGKETPAYGFGSA